MGNDSYKYDPNDYVNISMLSEDLELFFNLHRKYLNDKSFENHAFMEKQGIDLFFTIKHRALEGAITAEFANSLREYMRELLDD